MKRVKVLLVATIVVVLAGGCGKNDTNPTIENIEITADEIGQEKVENTLQWETFTPPTKEEVESARSLALEGMTEEEIEHLTENIKVANLAMERAYLDDRIFDKLLDKEHLYWNYVDQEGDIQIGWAYEGTYKDIREIRDEEGLTLDEFYEKYGTPVTAYNRFDAENFIELMEDMKDGIDNAQLSSCLDELIENMEKAAETHEVEPMQKIHMILHDMDYYLLRHGPSDVGPYVDDHSFIDIYYGTLPFYESTEE